MFDPYSQISAHTRKEAFLHPRKLPTWQDAIRESRDTDLDPQGQEFSSGSLVFSFAASLRLRFNQWRLSWSHRPFRQMEGQKPDMAIERHSQVRR